MQSIIKPVELKTFKAYPIIIAVMALLQVLSTIYDRKFFLLFGFNGSVGRMVMLPAVLYVFQIVSECYGWQYARQIVWANFTVNVGLTVITFLCKFIPYSSFNHADLQGAYSVLMDTMWVSALTNCLAIFFSDYISSALMAWSKFYWNGRLLLLRVILLHIISEMIILSANFITLPYNGYPISQVWVMTGNGFIARTIVSLILLPVTGFTIWYLQEKIEKVVAFDTGRDSWNIFHWNVDSKNTVQFDAKEWSRLSAEKKKRVDVNKIALDYYTDDKLGVDKIFKNDHMKQNS